MASYYRTVDLVLECGCIAWGRKTLTGTWCKSCRHKRASTWVYVTADNGRRKLVTTAEALSLERLRLQRSAHLAQRMTALGFYDADGVA